MKYRQFSLFHLSLVPIRQPTFETLTDLTREGWIRRILSSSFEFPYRAGETLHWVPQEDVEGLIFGIIERSKDRRQHLPPALGGLEITREEWQGAYVLVDPAHHEDGQKMAVENDIVGSPQTLVKYLSNYINSRDDRPYEFEPSLIFDSSDYYAFIKDNGPKLSYIKFHFVVPNMWGTAKKLDQDLRESGEETGAEELDVTFKSRRGVDGDSQRIREGVDYAARGAGNVRAKSVNGPRYRSDSSPTTTQVEEREDDVVEESARDWIGRHWRRILGRE